MKKSSEHRNKKVFFHMFLLGMIACFSHFVYEISGNNMFLGLFNPINESVWEHLKFMFFPLLFWWIIMYGIRKDKWGGSRDTWIVTAAISLLLSPLIVVFVFYSYTGALGIESLLIDILLVFLSYTLTLFLAFHLLEFFEPPKWMKWMAVFLVFFECMAFLLFSFIIPTGSLPIFQYK